VPFSTGIVGQCERTKKGAVGRVNEGLFVQKKMKEKKRQRRVVLKSLQSRRLHTQETLSSAIGAVPGENPPAPLPLMLILRCGASRLFFIPPPDPDPAAIICPWWP